MDNYYEFLKNELNNFDGDFDNFILYIPELFKLLCSLLEENLDKEIKLRINSALAYFVIPNDVISEDIYGPAGYIDDVFVCVVVLKEIRGKYGIKLLEKNWEGDEEIGEVIDLCYDKSFKELEEKKLVEAVLKGSNLK